MPNLGIIDTKSQVYLIDLQSSIELFKSMLDSDGYWQNELTELTTKIKTQTDDVKGIIQVHENQNTTMAHTKWIAAVKSK